MLNRRAALAALGVAGATTLAAGCSSDSATGGTSGGNGGEAVWGIGLLILLGRDPMVGVLALAIPFGAITAKVYAEIIDETPSAPTTH